MSTGDEGGDLREREWVQRHRDMDDWGEYFPAEFDHRIWDRKVYQVAKIFPTEAVIWKAPEIFYEVSVYRYPCQEKHFAASGIVI